MGESGFRRLMAVCLTVVFSSSILMADNGAAMLFTSGAAAVNGENVTRSSAVFAGDRIETRTAPVTIAAEGSTVIVPKDSAVVFGAKAVEVERGAVEISTKNGMAARINDVTVQPVSNGSAKFQVAKVNGKVTVAALSGAVTMSDGNGSTVVQEGTSTTANGDPANPDQSQGKKKRRKAGLLLPLGVGVGTAAGSAVAIITTGPPESPVRP